MRKDTVKNKIKVREPYQTIPDFLECIKELIVYIASYVNYLRPRDVHET